MSRFNVRVYGIWINDSNEILLSDESVGDFHFTKFPGGGLELGEGIIDCLVREWKEELDSDIEVAEHIYTTDFFQISTFDDSQIISIYYKVKPINFPAFILENKVFDFEKKNQDEYRFRWKLLSDLTENDLTLPIDKRVVALLKSSASEV